MGWNQPVCGMWDTKISGNGFGPPEPFETTKSKIPCMNKMRKWWENAGMQWLEFFCGCIFGIPCCVGVVMVTHDHWPFDEKYFIPSTLTIGRSWLKWGRNTGRNKIAGLKPPVKKFKFFFHVGEAPPIARKCLSFRCYFNFWSLFRLKLRLARYHLFMRRDIVQALSFIGQCKCFWQDLVKGFGTGTFLKHIYKRNYFR